MKDRTASGSGCGGGGGCGCGGGRGEAAGAGRGGAGTASPGPNATEAAGPGRDGTSRRDFLKVLGLSGAGAAAAACSPPDATDRLIPYLVDPEDVTPGEVTRYATVLTGGGPQPLALHARTREGRAIFLEGNPDFPTNRGRLSALAQSALQDLYDPDRVPGPRRRNGDEFEETSWEEAIEAASEAARGEGVVLFTEPATGTRADFYRDWAEAAGAEHIGYELLNLEALRTGHEIAYGRREIPAYALDRADRIVSFGADFLETWLAPVTLSRRFAAAREIGEGRHAKFTFVGPRVSLTGSNADEWLPARSGREGLVALAAARTVAEVRGGAAVSQTGAALQRYTPEWAAERTGVDAGRIRALGEELAAADRPVALPPGAASRDAAAADAHVAVAILNQVLGAVGETVLFGVGPARASSAGHERLADLVVRMGAGQVETVIVAGGNPVYTIPRSLGFAAALTEVPNVISLGPHLDETAAASHWILPSHHELESWGDAEVRPGIRALSQPVMTPVFETRQREDILLELVGAGALAAAGDTAAAPAEQEPPEDAEPAADFAEYLRNAWRELHAETDVEDDFESWWHRALRRGGLWEEAPDRRFPEAPGETGESLRLTSAALEYDFSFIEHEETGFDLVVYPTTQFYDGRGANRSWMQEFPDPVTKAVWNSWVEMHPDTAEPLGLETGDVVELESPAGSVRAPVYLYHGIRPDTVAIPLGQGHTAYGRNAAGRGVNPLDLLPPVPAIRSDALPLAGGRVRATATGTRAPLVIAQSSDSDQGREIAKLTEIDAAREQMAAHQVDLGEMVRAARDSDPMSPYRWGMSIDLNACTGCGACVTACYAENNLATVGEEQVAMGREMAWLRIDRYYRETEDGSRQAVHAPILCQHCGNAPCEPVCPVYATYHNPEGLNVQVYNRCVGTRYCSNNCPYKVRRFNWFSYEFPHPLNLQLNPDVTVRDKGVMEKCTFCVQRINRARIEAKSEGRLIEDGEVVTACQGACPTRAIEFGNLKDPTSRVSRIAKGSRSYHVLEDLNTRPAITYLEGVTHAEPAAAEGGHGAEAENGHGPEAENGNGAEAAGGRGAENGHRAEAGGGSGRGAAAGAAGSREDGR